MDYIRWVLRLDFCTPRYVILWELGLEKFKIGWGIMRYEKRNREKQDGSLVRACLDMKLGRKFSKGMKRT